MPEEIGEKGQQKLSGSSVLVVGSGGLGSPVLYYLAALGVGHLGVCDGDKVELSNLNRQILFTVNDLDKPKARVAKERLKALNPSLKVTVYDCFIDEKLAAEAVCGYDAVVDCLDNFEARFILNDASINAGKPLIHAGIGEYYGQLMTIIPGKGPCLRCLFPNGVVERVKQGDSSPAGEPSPTGVIGPTPGVLGAMQAMEVAKCLLGLQVCNDGLVMYDGLSLTMEKVPLKASPKCRCRGK